MTTDYVAYALIAFLFLNCMWIIRVRRGTYAAREHAQRKQAFKGRTTATEITVALKPWHSLLAETGYMGSVVSIPMRPGHIVTQIADDKGNIYRLKKPFRALDKGTLMIYIHDLSTGDVEYEWRRLTA